MTFRQWVETNDICDLPDVVYRYAEAAWQAAQQEERNKARELKKVLLMAMQYVPTDYPWQISVHDKARAAIAKYQGESNEP